MNITALKTLINSHPDIATISDADLLAWCNTPSVTVIQPTMMSTRGLMAALGPVLTDTIMTKLEAAAQVDSVLARVISMMSPAEGGIDLGDLYTRASLDQLVVDNVLSQSEVDALKSIAETTISPARNAGLGVVRLGELEFARVN